MNRRGFLKAMLAACAAPAIVRASSLMPIRGWKQTQSGLLFMDDDLILGQSVEEIVRRDLAQAIARNVDKLFVSGEFGDDANDGLSWATPKRTLPAAADAAQAGTTIYIRDASVDLRPGGPEEELHLNFVNCRFDIPREGGLLLPAGSQYDGCTFIAHNQPDDVLHAFDHTNGAVRRSLLVQSDD